MQRYYHVTSKRFRVGDVVCSPKHQNVYLTTSPVPHFTIAGRVLEVKRAHVYEVEPLPPWHHGGWDDLVAKCAVVRRYVGSAKGILANYWKHHPLDRERQFGSIVFHEQAHRMGWR